MNDVIDLPEATTLPAINNPTPSYLLQMAIQKGADIDQLERLMALQERWEANEARKAYDTAFAAFKAQAVVIVKNRKVTAGPLAGKSYAELFSVVNAVTPALSAHGLSSSWKITKDEPQWLEVTCTIKHVAGHTESVSMGGPPDVGGAKNAIQARASTVSYLERYTLKAITGLSEQDDDDNGGRSGPEPRGNDDLDKLIQDGRQTAMDGMKALTAWYNKLTATQKSEVNPEFGRMRAAARTADQGGAA
jgi:hypothetical protein